MLSITKLGIEVLSRFAKKEEANFCFKGDAPVKFFEERFCIIPQHTTKQNTTDFEFKDAYLWDWENGLVKITDPFKDRFGYNVTEILMQRRKQCLSEFTHIALMQECFETKEGSVVKQFKELAVYRFIKLYYDQWQHYRAEQTLGTAYRN